MSTAYFQLGGFRGNITSSKMMYDEKDLANTIAGFSSPLRSRDNPGDPIELVLGIKSSGSSHLLLTLGQLNAFTRTAGPSSLNVTHRSLLARDFESLSPISFDTVEALAKKMSSLKPKAGKFNERDSSQANRIYNSGGIEPYRGGFEHGRVIYRILNDLIDPTNYACYDTSWKRDLRVSSFIFNVMAVDDRKKEERVRNPRILDIGFCSATLPGLALDDTKSYHIINRNNMYLGGNRTPFSHGTSETVDAKSLDARINQFFQEHKHRSSTPTILLIYNEERTRGCLDKLNVDTSAWIFHDLKDLVFSGASNITGSNRPYHDSRYGSGTSRSRSRSPTRHHHSSFQSNRGSRYSADYRSAGSSSSSQNPSNQGPKLYHPVYVIDLEQLYNKLMRNDQIRSLKKVAENVLGANIQGICAGNEAAMAIHLWKEMISGPSIDEQRELRLQRAEETLAGSHSSGPSNVPSQAMEGDSEEEQDPNEYVAPTGGALSKPAQASRAFSDESDYGDDDDSDSD